jgi:hypothetical protein
MAAKLIASAPATPPQSPISLLKSLGQDASDRMAKLNMLISNNSHHKSHQSIYSSMRCEPCRSKFYTSSQCAFTRPTYRRTREPVSNSTPEGDDFKHRWDGPQASFNESAKDSPFPRG